VEFGVTTEGKFPSRPYDSPESYFAAYRDEIARAWSTIDAGAVARAAVMLQQCVARDGIIYACGNGGSAAIANHLLCDFHKGIQTDTALKPRIVSLSTHLELLTAIANDIGYEDIFVYQLRTMARPGDLLLTISSSGDSENIVRAVQGAKENGIATIAMVGFAGGRAGRLADVTLHVAAENYGVVEDAHQSMMHVLAQYLRQAAMAPGLVAQRKF
jgi:D-sedoheptulose 7-phosphate isomerase